MTHKIPIREMSMRSKSSDCGESGPLDQVDESSEGEYQKVFWKTQKGRVPLRLSKLKAQGETIQVRTQRASVRQGEVKISLTEACGGGEHHRSLQNIRNPSS